MTVALLGYRIGQVIYTGTRTLVYRGQRESDNRPVVIKFPGDRYPTFSELLQFRNQYTIAKNLNIPGIIHPLSLESCGNSYALVMPDEGAISLWEYAKTHSLELRELLAIAVQLADILHDLHQNRIIHKDIKPANILIHPDTKQVKLIDFSIASLLPKETQEIKNPNVLEGTLAYLAPEQTGRMNRGIDYRSDFYALGVTLFELLAGQLPFESDDAMELIHSHIAKQPPALVNREEGRGKREQATGNRQQATGKREEGTGNRQQATGNRKQGTGNREQGTGNRKQGTGNREQGTGNRQQVTGNREEIPSVLADIVMKLMAKNAEDRYQSALGLKYDLEICLQQLQETGKIEEFEIGQRDLCDRFIIPEKLYGREAEVQILLDAFDRAASGSSELMLVAGFSGIGKTAVVSEVHKPIVRQRGYFIKGKYDQFQRNIPFSAFVKAFRDLMEQLSSESDAQLQIWKTKILEAVGDSGQVLIDVIPELEQIIGTQPPATELSGTAAQNRFNRVMQKFVQVFTSREHPLAIFLDDLQWADSASLKLLQLLMNETGHLLILGAYRDNEVSSAHPFMLAVYEIVKNGAKVNTIDLQALSLADLNQLVADTLNCELSIAQPLTELVYQKTKGNPFFATQFLKALHEDKLITFDPPQSHASCYNGRDPRNALAPLGKGGREGGWQCDIAGVRALAITDDVVEFMALQLLKLPPQTQDVLKLAACIGAQFDLNTLEIVSEQSQTDVATALWKALQEGLVLPITETYKFFQGADLETLTQEITVAYKFLHDRVQQAAYSLIPEEQKQVTHLKIGQLMLEKIPQLTLKDKIFHVVNHLNIGSEPICDPTQREQLAILNLRAGQKAKVATAYADAVKYLNFSLALLEAEKWQSQYDLMLSVHIEAAEAEYLNTNFQKLASLAQIVLEKAKTVIDEMKIYELQIQSYQLQSMMLKAIDTGLKALEKLGIFLSASICDRPMPDLPRIEDLDNIPEMKEPGQLAALRIMMALYPPIYIAKPDSIEPLILTMVKLCIEGGHSALAAYSYVLYGIILCAKKESIDRGYYAGQIALKLLDKFQAEELKAKIYVLFNAHIRCWKEPVRSTINAYLEGYQSGLKTGDIEWASYNCKHYCKNLFISGENLELVEKEQALYQSVIVKNNHEFALYYARIWMQAALNLQGKATDRLKLIGKDFDESLLIPLWQSNKNYMSLFALYLVKANLAYLFDDVTAALDRASIAREYIGASLGLITTGVYNFYLSLILLAAYPQLETSKQQQYLSDVKENQENLKEWSVHAPQNFHHKYLLVQAEMARVLGKKLQAVDLYDRAISLAKENKYIQEEALANELAAKFYLDWGKEKFAQIYMTEAYYCYARWGAKAKVVDLETRYPQLLVTILQKQQPSFKTMETVISVGAKKIQSSTISHTGFSEALDLANILKASQLLSSEIELDKLLSSLLEVILKIAGAQKCALLMPTGSRWVIEALSQLKQPDRVLQSLPFEDGQTVPVTLINRVKNTLSLVAIENAANDPTLVADSYIQRHSPKSIFCAPMLDRGKPIGILYLENNLTVGAFTRDRLEVLHLLMSQAAISLENARLYAQLEDRVKERTQELNQKNQQLQTTLKELHRTQAQMVQTEKMSALGQLVAGIAHEINNPINFINGNLHHIDRDAQDLLHLLNAYQLHYPHPPESLLAEIENVEFDFLKEDLPNILRSMKVGSDRVRQIVLSLRNFSRLDESEYKAVNLHEGLDNTLMILQHRFKTHAERPAIEIVKQYGELPLVECCARDLNQVFMNLIVNAIDSLEESDRKRSIQEITSKQNRISISTILTEQNQVKIIIADNGIGISERVRSRLFDPFFTTKPVGKGTGLGLAIVRQIVVEKHGGTIDVNSEAGKGAEFVLTLPVN